jgi:hypothetical protein
MQTQIKLFTLSRKFGAYNLRAKIVRHIAVKVVSAITNRSLLTNMEKLFLF